MGAMPLRPIPALALLTALASMVGCSSETPTVSLAPLTGQAASWLITAQSSLNRGEYLAGLSYVDSVLTLASNRAEPHILRGRLLAELNRYADAEAAYSRAAELDPAYPGLWLNRGNVAFAQQQYEQALEAYRRESLREARVHHALGGALDQLGRADSASAAYRASVNLDPDYAPAWYSLSRYYEAQGEVTDALEAARRSLALRPNRPDYQLQSARMEVQAGSPEAGLELLIPLVQTQPWNYTALFALGQGLRSVGDEAEARVALSHADSVRSATAETEKLELAARDSPSAGSFVRYAEALRRQGRLEESIAAYQRAVGLSPSSTSLQINLATLYLQAGREAEGVQRLQALVASSPDAIEGWINLALFYGRKGDLERTREMLRRAEGIDPDNAMLRRLQASLPPAD